VSDLHYRPMVRDDIARLPEIDRYEEADQLYAVRDGQLVVRDQQWTHPGWDQAYYDVRLPRLYASFDHDGAGWSVEMDGRLAAITVLDGRWMDEANPETLDLTFIHVTRQLRANGVGREIYDRTAALARSRGARHLYVSASASRKTVDFYLRRGMYLAPTPDPTLFAMEPDNVHLLLDL
jgi:GNAT superfamily N-acetyltransferase